MHPTAAALGSGLAASEQAVSMQHHSLLSSLPAACGSSTVAVMHPTAGALGSGLAASERPPVSFVRLWGRERADRIALIHKAGGGDAWQRTPGLSAVLGDAVE